MPGDRVDLVITLSGRFRIEDTDGRRVDISSAKGKALIALIATQKHMERGRHWLQDKLWSDRGAESGAASLRQELTQIRKNLGIYADVLEADRQTVRLRSDRVTVVEKSEATGEEFLEGLDVRDNEFNNWLLVERVRRSAGGDINEISLATTIGDVGSPDVTIALFGVGSASETCRVMEAQLLDRTARALSDFCAVSVHSGMPNEPISATYSVTLQVFRQPHDSVALRASCDDLVAGVTLWSETIEDVSLSETIDVPWSLLALTNRIVAKVTKEISHAKARNDAESSAASLASQAIHGIFTIGKDELAAADQLLKKAYEIDPRGVFKAWRVQLAVIQYVERYETDLKDLYEKGEELSAQSVAEDPLNSNVLAAAANFRSIMEKNVVSGLELARLSIRANSANPLGWWSLSNAVQYTGDSQTAYLAALRAHNLAQGTKLEFWTAFQRSLSAALIKKPAEAIRLGELSNALSPNFAPPLRYLLALYANVEDTHSARRVLKNLQKKEADFSLDRMIRDPDYPVSIARSAGLLDASVFDKRNL